MHNLELLSSLILVLLSNQLKHTFNCWNAYEKMLLVENSIKYPRQVFGIAAHGHT